jgi:hypothetical protein
LAGEEIRFCGFRFARNVSSEPFETRMTRIAPCGATAPRPESSESLLMINAAWDATRSLPSGPSPKKRSSRLVAHGAAHRRGANSRSFAKIPVIRVS